MNCDNMNSVWCESSIEVGLNWWVLDGRQTEGLPHTTCFGGAIFICDQRHVANVAGGSYPAAHNITSRGRS